MRERYRILYLEDVNTDAELVEKELYRSDILSELRVIETEREYLDALDHFFPDVILCDHSLPAFSSFKALQILKEKKLFIPFIVITATMTEELAMSIVREGADDFIMKDRLKRLSHAVINVVEKYRFEKERKQLIDKAQKSESLNNEVLGQLSDKVLLATRFSGIGIWEYIFDSAQFIADDVLIGLYGIKPIQFNGNPESLMKFIHPDDRTAIDLQFREAIENQSSFETSYRVIWPDQSVHYIKGKSIVQRDKAGFASRLIGTTEDCTAVKHAEQQLLTTTIALQHALNSLNKVMDSSLDIICSINTDGRFAKVSAACEQLLGYHPDELTGRLFMDFVCAEDSEITEKTAARIMLGEEVTNFENRYIRKDGTLVPIVWSAKWDDKEQLMYCVARNATEKQEVQKVFETERRRYENLFMQAPAFICILKGPEHVFQMANPDFDRLVQKTNYVGMRVKDSFPEVVDQGFLAMLDGVYSTGNSFIGNEMVIHLNDPDGAGTRERFINFSCQAHRNMQNQIEGIFVFGADVTDQMYSKREIEKSEKRYRQIVETAQEGIWVIDEHDHTGFVNKKMCEMIGYSSDELMGKKIFDYVVPEGREEFRIQIQSRFEKGNQTSDFKLNTKSGGLTWVNISSNPIVRADGSYGGSLAMMTDITERKLSEIQLKEMNENLQKHARDLSVTNDELEQFAYVASHDLQEPLRMVTSYLTQIENKYGDLLDDKGKQYIYFAVDGAKRMRQIILDLLEFSRVGRTEDNLVALDLNKMIGEILILSKGQVEEMDATIHLGDLPTITTYESPMRQVFQNLISNALKYARSDLPCQIEIRSHESNGEWVFSVKDNGIGIEKEYFQKIFVIFQRLHNRDQYAGTGMGLAITKKIIDLQGGKIWVDSDEGKGSTFYFSLPKKIKDPVVELN